MWHLLQLNSTGGGRERIIQTNSNIQQCTTKKIMYHELPGIHCWPDRSTFLLWKLNFDIPYPYCVSKNAFMINWFLFWSDKNILYALSKSFWSDRDLWSIFVFFNFKMCWWTKQYTKSRKYTKTNTLKALQVEQNPDITMCCIKVVFT